MDGWTDGYTVAFIINPSEDNPLQLFSLCLVSKLLQNLQKSILYYTTLVWRKKSRKALHQEQENKGDQGFDGWTTWTNRLLKTYRRRRDRRKWSRLEATNPRIEGG